MGSSDRPRTGDSRICSLDPERDESEPSHGLGDGFMVYPVNFGRFYRRRRDQVKETWLSSRSVIATFILFSLSLMSSPIALLHYFCARGGQRKVRVELLQLAMLTLNLLVLFYLLGWSQYWFLVSISRLFDLL